MPRPISYPVTLEAEKIYNRRSPVIRRNPDDVAKVFEAEDMVAVSYKESGYFLE